MRLLLSLLMLLAACAARADDFSYVVHPDALAYAGLITPASVKIFTDYLEGGGTRIVINSRGGDSASGLAIAKAMETHPVELVVDQYCMSACANFLFIGASQKSLRPGAILGFHGDLLSSPRTRIDKKISPLSTDAELDDINKGFAELCADEEAHFRRIGVDAAFFKLSTIVIPADQPHYIDITSHGKVVQRFDLDQADDAKKLMDALQKKTGESGFSIGAVTFSQKMYFPSAATLARYGVRGILAYPYPDSAAALARISKAVELSVDAGELITYGDF